MSAWTSAHPPRIGSTQACSSCEPFPSSTRLTGQNRSRKPLPRGHGGMGMITATRVTPISSRWVRSVSPTRAVHCAISPVPEQTATEEMNR